MIALPVHSNKNHLLFRFSFCFVTLYTFCLFSASAVTDGRWLAAQDQMKQTDRRFTPMTKPVKMILGLNSPGEDFEIKAEVSTVRRTKLIRLQQIHHGIRVYGALVTMEVYESNRKYTGKAFGKILSGLNKKIKKTVPRISAEEAMERTKAASGLDTDSTTFTSISTEVVVTTDVPDTVPHLTYRVKLQAVINNTVCMPEAFVHGDTGKIISYWDNMVTAAFIATSMT